ncbi:amino acid permease C-terminal domain-containing protein [Paraburkholderia sp.]|jgi:APA family basic amino acid/polyamine antiporter
MLDLLRIAWAAFGIWLAMGMVMYIGYSRRRSKRAK